MHYVVTRAPGVGWDASRPMRGQDAWDEHAAFMDGLAAEGFIVLGGPLGDGTTFLHVVAAASTQEIEERLAADPWTATEQLRLVSIEPWEILLRAPRLALQTMVPRRRAAYHARRQDAAPPSHPESRSHPRR
jgi:uncharacterized protein YciI